MKLDFLVLGAQKAGTTRLHNCFARDSRVSMPVNKETHFFRDSKKYAQGISWYEGEFASSGPVRAVGEIDPEYLYYRHSIREIKKHSKDGVRLGVLLRDPIDRALSHYLMSVYRGLESRSFASSILGASGDLQKVSLESIHRSYLNRSDYQLHLDFVLKSFSREHLVLGDYSKVFDCPDSARIFSSNVIGFESESVVASLVTNVRDNVAKSTAFPKLNRMMYAKDGSFAVRIAKKVARGVLPSAKLRERIFISLSALFETSEDIGSVKKEALETAICNVEARQSLVAFIERQMEYLERLGCEELTESWLTSKHVLKNT